MTLHGYVRSDGRVGFRNYVLVMPLTGCQSEVARRIADRVPGTTCFAHPNGCDLQGPDFDLMGSILEHFVTHPNVGGVLFLAMGCSATLSLKLPVKAKKAGRLVHTINAQQCGGTTKTVEAGVAAAQQMLDELSEMPRTEVPFSALIIGTKCGASDANSFKYCHPVGGKACDMLVEKGATVVLSEDCELIAAADLLAERAVNREVATAIKDMAAQVNDYWKARFGYTLESWTLQGTAREAWVQASLAHAAKAGTTPITGFFDMAETVKGPGLVILNAPNTDLENVTCLAAAGCNVTLFTTGRGTYVGSPASITLKITATDKTLKVMEENIDLCIGGVIDGRETLDQAAGKVVDMVIAVANGQLAKAEIARHYEVAMPIRGVTF